MSQATALGARMCQGTFFFIKKEKNHGRIKRTFCKPVCRRNCFEGVCTGRRMVGALGAALMEMVANLTIGKEKYAGVQAEMQALAAEGAALHEELLAGIKKDSESFNGYMRALKLSKETEEEKKIRTAALQQGLKEATEAPLAIAESAAKIFPMAEAVVKRGNKGAVSDGLIAAMLARTAVVGALFNVKINLASIKDESYVSELEKRVEKLESDAIFCEKSILCLSKLSDTVYNR